MLHEVVDRGAGQRPRVAVGVEEPGQVCRAPHPRGVQHAPGEDRRGVEAPPRPVVDPPGPLEEPAEALDRPAPELVVAGAAVSGKGVVGLGRELDDLDGDGRTAAGLVAQGGAGDLELEQRREQRALAHRAEAGRQGVPPPVQHPGVTERGHPVCAGARQRVGVTVGAQDRKSDLEHLGDALDVLAHGTTRAPRRIGQQPGGQG